MSNVLTPEWVNAGAMSLTAIATTVGAGAVIWGAITANRKLSESLETKRQTKRAEVAENLIVLAYKTHYALDDIRRSYGYIPRKPEYTQSDQFEHHDKQLEKHGQTFERLQEAEIYARTILGYDDVKDAVETLCNMHSDIFNTFGELLMYEVDFYQHREEDKQIRKEKYQNIKDLQQNVYGIHSNDNDTSQKINNALKTIETKLSPIARIEENKSKRTKT